MGLLRTLRHWHVIFLHSIVDFRCWSTWIKNYALDMASLQYLFFVFHTVNYVSTSPELALAGRLCRLRFCFAVVVPPSLISSPPLLSLLVFGGTELLVPGGEGVGGRLFIFIEGGRCSRQKRCCWDLIFIGENVIFHLEHRPQPHYWHHIVANANITSPLCLLSLLGHCWLWDCCLHFLLF